MKKLIINLSVLFLVFIVVPLFPGEVLAQKQVFVGGATIGTSPYVFAVGFTTLANKYCSNYKFMVQATGGSTENIKLLNQRELDIAMITPGVLTAARQGTRWFKDLKESKRERYDNVRGILVYFFGALHFIVKEGSPIHNMYDIKGKRVALGAPGSPAGLMSISILEAHGLKKNVDYTGVEVDASSASEAWQDGMVDLWCIYSEIPGGLVANATALNKFRLLPLEDEKAIKTLRDNKVLSVEEGTLLTSVEPKTYPTMMNTKSAVQFATLSGFNAHKDVSDDIVYCFTKAIFDQIEEFWRNVGPTAKFVNLREALNGMVVPLHPGAAKYFQEKGVIK